MSITKQIIDYVKRNPGATSQQIHGAMPEGTKKHTVQNILGRLRRDRVVVNQGGSFHRWNQARYYIYEADATEYAKTQAHDIYREMLELPTLARENFLAEKLEEMFETQPYE